jgi:hypothetical protein
VILSKSTNPDAKPVFEIGQRVNHITDGGRSFRIATVIHNGGTRIGIRYVVGGKETRVWPWNLRHAQPTKERTEL